MITIVKQTRAMPPSEPPTMGATFRFEGFGFKVGAEVDVLNVAEGVGGDEGESCGVADIDDVDEVGNDEDEEEVDCELVGDALTSVGKA
jgi:hypothetical protein